MLMIENSAAGFGNFSVNFDVSYQSDDPKCLCCQTDFISDKKVEDLLSQGTLKKHWDYLEEQL